MKEFISPNDEKLFGANDSETIQNAISAAEADGCRQIIIPRYNARTDKNEWRIPVSIKIPSDFTVILDNCYMVQETGAYDNMFTNKYSWDFEKITKLEYEQKNIAVIGRGNVILDGGEHNHLLEKTQSKFRQPNLWRNDMFLWMNVDGLRVENLHIQNQRYWAFNHNSCRNVKIRDLDFYAIPHVNTMDGIDMRAGCNHFDIQNITGRTGDDVIAMNALQWNNEVSRKVDGKDIDIHDIKLRNIKADPYYCFIVRILNHDGCNIYNVDIDTIMDVSDYTKKMPSGACVAVGSTNYSRFRPAEHGDTRNITVKNVTSRSRNTICMSNTLSHAKFSNIKTYGDNRNCVGIDGRCTLEDVTFEHMWYGACQQEILLSRALTPDKYHGTAIRLADIKGDVTFKDVNADQVRRCIVLSGDAKVTIDGFKYNCAKTPIEVAPESTLIIDGEEQ